MGPHHHGPETSRSKPQERDEQLGGLGEEGKGKGNAADRRSDRSAHEGHLEGKEPAEEGAQEEADGRSEDEGAVGVVAAAAAHVTTASHSLSALLRGKGSRRY